MNDLELTTAQQKVAAAEARAERLKRWIRLIAAAFAFVVVAVIVSGVVLIRTTQQEGSPAVKQIIEQGEQQRELLDVIRSCTDPNGKCFKEGQARTGEAVLNITVGTVYAVTCGVNLAREDPTISVEDVQACVADLTNKNPPGD